MSCLLILSINVTLFASFLKYIFYASWTTMSLITWMGDFWGETKMLCQKGKIYLNVVQAHISWRHKSNPSDHASYVSRFMLLMMLNLFWLSSNTWNWKSSSPDNFLSAKCLFRCDLLLSKLDKWYFKEKGSYINSRWVGSRKIIVASEAA